MTPSTIWNASVEVIKVYSINNLALIMVDLTFPVFSSATVSSTIMLAAVYVLNSNAIWGSMWRYMRGRGKSCVKNVQQKRSKKNRKHIFENTNLGTDREEKL